ncbi:HNH endonuclease [Caryophanon tenue]|uniref:HNH nuclease domain-containing protein n=1 Tax=Caryophanon tenue TaxID=33978 RepID=A0A1C0Y555_9BACL|nr:HNH endonuclease [Caryophanon tenue]OCS82264.1 hypothetical protein A6M13_07460 [Caryophanon tenue]
MNEIVQELLKEIDLDKLYEIPNYSNYAADLRNGRIFNKVTQKWVTASPSKIGYCYAHVKSDSGIASSIGVHVLIMSAALDGFDWKKFNLEVDHVDFDRSNNSILNLMLAPRAVNRARRKMAKNTKRLDTNVIDDLRQEYKELIHGTKHDWCVQKATEYGVSYRCIQNNVLGYNNKGVI